MRFHKFPVFVWRFGMKRDLYGVACGDGECSFLGPDHHLGKGNEAGVISPAYSAYRRAKRIFIFVVVVHIQDICWFAQQ